VDILKALYNLANTCYFHDYRIVALAHDYENLLVFYNDETVKKYLPYKFEGFPVKTCCVKCFYPASLTYLSARSMVRPIVGGISVGILNKNVAGTIAFPAYYKGIPVIVSSSHVIAEEGNASVGTRIIQPSEIDGGNKNHVIGWLLSSTRIHYPPETNIVDGAIATLETNYSHSILGIGKINGETEPRIGMVVRKMGRSSFLTKGIIIGVNALVKVSGYSRGTAIFEDQIITAKVADFGDSGAAIVDRDNNVVGIINATATFYSVASKIENVKKILGIKIL
jgi:hypothetical protein